MDRKKAMQPKISVAIIALADSANTKRAIDSVLSQSYGDIEIIVIYDGYQNKLLMNDIGRIYTEKLTCYQVSGLNAVSALNMALERATGQFFSWISGEDVSLINKIETLVSYISDDATVVVSGWTAVNRNNRKKRTHLINRNIELYPRAVFAFDNEADVNTMTMLFPMKLLRKHRFSVTSSPACDYALLDKIAKNGAKFKIANDVLSQHLVIEDNSYRESLKTKDTIDRVRSDIIAGLNYDEILMYFDGSKDGVIKYYNDTLKINYPRICAYLMRNVIVGLLSRNDVNAAEMTLTKDLSNLDIEKHSTLPAELIEKISHPSNKRKILFSSAQWLTGGMERVMSVLFEQLKDEFDIMLITPYDSRESQIEVPSYVTNIKIDIELFKKHFDSLILTYALLLEIDVIIGYINLFEKQQNIYNLCVGTKIKTIASNHEYYYYPYKIRAHYDTVQSRLEAFKNCDAIVWPTNFSAALCGMFTDRNYVIGNPNTFSSKQSVPKESSKKKILCVGRFNDPIKRIDRVLDCFSRVLKLVPDASLEVVGKFDYDAPIDKTGRTIRSMIGFYSIPLEKLNFVGEVNNVEEYFKGARVFLLTSVSEGFGMVVNEAASFGVPSVCNYIPGIEDIVKDGKNGYIVEQDDIGNMALRVRDILEDNSLYEQMSKNAIKMVSKFDAKTIGDKWQFLINNLIETSERREIDKILLGALGYKIESSDRMSKVLAYETNDILVNAIKNMSDQENLTGLRFVVHKVLTIPRRLKANVEFEGYSKTASKILVRSLRILKRKLYGK